jgi:Cft2 family RNA processing exonuclease
MSSDQKYPNFNFLTDKELGNDIKIDLVLLSHFHNDHCGALPYFTEQYGYDGPIIMTHPTKAIIPLMLEDARIIEERESKKANTMRQGFQNMPNAPGQPGQMQMNDGWNLYNYNMTDEPMPPVKEKDPSMFEPSKITKEMISK